MPPQPHDAELAEKMGRVLEAVENLKGDMGEVKGLLHEQHTPLNCPAVIDLRKDVDDLKVFKTRLTVILAATSAAVGAVAGFFLQLLTRYVSGKLHLGG